MRAHPLLCLLLLGCAPAASRAVSARAPAEAPAGAGAEARAEPEIEPETEPEPEPEPGTTPTPAPLRRAPSIHQVSATFDSAGQPWIAWREGHGLHVGRVEGGALLEPAPAPAPLGLRGVGPARGDRSGDGFPTSEPVLTQLPDGSWQLAWIDQAPPWGGGTPERYHGGLRVLLFDGAAWRARPLPRGDSIGAGEGCRRWSAEMGPGSETPALLSSPSGELWVACLQPRRVPGSPNPRMWPSAGYQAHAELELRHLPTRGPLRRVFERLSPAPRSVGEISHGERLLFGVDASGAPFVFRLLYGPGGDRMELLRRERRGWARSTLPAPDRESFYLALSGGPGPRLASLSASEITVFEVSASGASERLRVPRPPLPSTGAQAMIEDLQLSGDRLLVLLTSAAPTAEGPLEHELHGWLYEGGAWESLGRPPEGAPRSGP